MVLVMQFLRKNNAITFLLFWYCVGVSVILCGVSCLVFQYRGDFVTWSSVHVVSINQGCYFSTLMYLARN